MLNMAPSRRNVHPFIHLKYSQCPQGDATERTVHKQNTSNDSLCKTFTTGKQPLEHLVKITVFCCTSLRSNHLAANHCCCSACKVQILLVAMHILTKTLSSGCKCATRCRQWLSSLLARFSKEQGSYFAPKCCLQVTNGWEAVFSGPVQPPAYVSSLKEITLNSQTASTLFS